MILVTERTLLRAGIKKVVHLNGGLIRVNKRTLREDPKGAELACITVKCVDGTYYCRTVDLAALECPWPLRLRQNFRRPLAAGAVAWFETRAPLLLYPIDKGAL